MSTVIVVGQLLKPSGLPAAGTVTFTKISDSSDTVATLTSAGALSATLTVGSAYQVTEALTGYATYTYRITPTAGTGGYLALGTLAPSVDPTARPKLAATTLIGGLGVLAVDPHTGGLLLRPMFKRGQATVANGTTSTVITHGLTGTPAAGDIFVTPAATWGSGVKWWIDTLTSTQFTLHTSADPGANVLFNWLAFEPGS